jgi:sensor histidine kinase YesM
MPGTENKVGWKYFRIECLLFFYFCFLGPVISDLEYSYYEKHNIWLFTSDLEYHLVTGIYVLGFNGLYYWGFLKRFIFHKQYFYLGVSIVAYIFLVHLYEKYVMDWSMSGIVIFSTKLRTDALEAFRQRKILFVANYFLTRIITLIGFAFLIRSLQQEEQVKTLKEQQLTSELNYLKAQLQPHFFFNTLNNIYALAIRQSGDTAPMVAKLAEMMRYILYESDRASVPLRSEIEFLENYVGIERIRYQKDTSILFDVQGLNGEDRIEPLLLLPFVENAFKHGLHRELENGYVHIVICISSEDLVMEVINSKPRLTSRSGAGMGLQNVKKRLSLLYENRHQLLIEEDEERYYMNLTLPVT